MPKPRWDLKEMDLREINVNSRNWVDSTKD